jgi:hypothetical protein
MSEQPLGYNLESDSSIHRFEYSPENPPPLDVLESKVFAVHATPILPKDGVMVAGARNISGRANWDDEPPSFRPTIHFSLGEVVREHRGGNWDEKPYAVVAPLKSLKEQLVNIYPNDTYILGNYRLTDESVLLVPRGTDTADLPEDVQVIEYNPQVGLRMAVDQTIRDKNGWPIRMQPGGVEEGSVATIDNVDINDANFFKAMYEDKPQVSYGTHLTPERGEAYRFGSIEQAINLTTKGYHSFGMSLGMKEMQFYRAFIDHHLTRLTKSLQAQNLPEDAMRVFGEKTAKLQGWLNVVDIDLEIRERFDRSLSGADASIIARLTTNRGNIDKLRTTTYDMLEELPTAPYGVPSEAAIAEAMQGMPPDETEEFMNKNEEIFDSLDSTKVKTHYAIKRWVLEKDDAAHEDGINTMLQQALEQTKSGDLHAWDEPIFTNLDKYLSLNSNRVSTALHILQQPYVHEYLQRAYDFTFPKGEPKTLENVLKTHPDTATLFNPAGLDLTEDQELAYKFLRDIGQVPKPEEEHKDYLNNFRTASMTAFEMRWANQRLKHNLETISHPMWSTRNLDDLPAGTTLSLYEVLKRDKEPSELWEKVGLKEEYKQNFLQDQLFWGSDMSLLDIYKMLKEKSKGS